MACIIAISKWLGKIHEEKKLLEKLEETQQKEAVLKAKLGPWLDEAYVISSTIEDKLVNLQRTHQKVREDSAWLVTD